jgi:DNA-binding transcriptional regulator YhcF (GntR family)
VGAQAAHIVIVTVDPGSALPPYEQLRAGISRLVALGQLAPGTKLPTVRQLATDLGLAPGTVARAYRELESEGIIITQGRHGTRVRQAPPPPPAAERQRRLVEAARMYAITARQLGVDAKTALAEAKNAIQDA